MHTIGCSNKLDKIERVGKILGYETYYVHSLDLSFSNSP